MSHPAELAVGRMEKRALGIMGTALLTVGGAGLLTNLLNRLTGHDPSKKIRKALPGAAPGAAPGIMPRFGFGSRLMMPHGGPMLLPPAYGLHAYRARMQ